MKYAVLIFLTPVAYGILYRSVLPIHWYIVRYFQYEYEKNIFFHINFIATIFQLLLWCALLFFLYKLSRKASYEVGFKDTKAFEKEGTLDRAQNIIIIGVISLICIFYEIIPIFNPGGSEAIVNLNQSRKFEVFFGLGTLYGLATASIFVFLVSEKRRYILLFVAFFIFISAGKKMSMLSFLLDFVLLSLVLRGGNNIRLVVIFPAIIGSVIFGFTILMITTETNLYELGDLISSVASIYYASSTSYLNAFWDNQLYTEAGVYKDSISPFAWFNYFLNPILKMLSLGGIEYSIGPYLGLYSDVGEEGSVFGVNPTIFFELFFVFSPEVGAVLSFPVIMVMVFLLGKSINSVFYYSLGSSSNHLFLALFWLEVFKFTFSAQFDFLNSFKSSILSIVIFLIFSMLTRITVSRND